MGKKVNGRLCSSGSGLSRDNGWDSYEQLGRYMERCIFFLLCFHLWIAGEELGLSYPLIRRCREASLNLRGVREAIVALMQRQFPFCVRTYAAIGKKPFVPLWLLVCLWKPRHTLALTMQGVDLCAV